MNLELDKLCINTIRFLSVDAVQKANSGHPGMLAMDESNPTCNQRVARLGIPQTEEVRRAWRELIVTMPGLCECISGAILCDETIHQQKKDDTPFVKAVIYAGIIAFKNHENGG